MWPVSRDGNGKSSVSTDMRGILRMRGEEW